MKEILINDEKRVINPKENERKINDLINKWDGLTAEQINNLLGFKYKRTNKTIKDLGKSRLITVVPAHELKIITRGRPANFNFSNNFIKKNGTPEDARDKFLEAIRTTRKELDINNKQPRK